MARLPGSRWVCVERGGNVFLHKDEGALAGIAEFLNEFAGPATHVASSAATSASPAEEA
jgi:hypothetical protein